MPDYFNYPLIGGTDARVGPSSDPRITDPRLQFAAQLSVRDLLSRLPENALTDFLMSMHPQVRFQAESATPWSLPDSYGLGFSMGRRW